MTDTFQDDEFWEAAAPFLFPASRWQSAPAEVEHILQLTRPQPQAAVLDLCCGPGRIAIEFARHGFQVTAVDRTAAYLDEARARAEREGLQIEFVQSDMRDFVRTGQFDLAVNLFTSFGFFATEAEDQGVLRNLYSTLKPGGKLLIDTMGREVLAAKFRPSDWQRLDDGSILIDERRILDGWSAVESKWTLIARGGKRQFTFRLRLYSGTQLAANLAEAGFTGVRLFGSLEGRPYDNFAERLAVVAYR